MNLFNDGTGILDVLSLHAAQESSGSKIDAGSSDQSTKAKAPTTGDGAAGAPPLVTVPQQLGGGTKAATASSSINSDQQKNATDSDDEEAGKYDDPAYSKYKYQVSCEAVEQQIFTPVEVEILQNLRQKSKDIDAREEELMIKESSLRAINQVLDNKLQSLTKTQEQLSKIANQYEGDENNKVDRIVKVYENMKPKEAARIFNELQIGLLLPVADRMKEQKLAAIIADMDPIKAKDLTTSIANKSRVLNLLRPEAQ